jgi:hypothetical protein
MLVDAECFIYISANMHDKIEVRVSIFASLNLHLEIYLQMPENELLHLYFISFFAMFLSGGIFLSSILLRVLLKTTETNHEN